MSRLQVQAEGILHFTKQSSRCHPSRSQYLRRSQRRGYRRSTCSTSLASALVPRATRRLRKGRPRRCPRRLIIRPPRRTLATPRCRHPLSSLHPQVLLHIPAHRSSGRERRGGSNSHLHWNPNLTVHFSALSPVSSYRGVGSQRLRAPAPAGTCCSSGRTLRRSSSGPADKVGLELARLV